MIRKIHQNVLISLLLVAVTAFAYWEGLHSEFNNYDDSQYITENAAIQSGLNFPSVRWAFTTGYAGNWHPLTWLSHMLDWQLYGSDAGLHHLTSLLLHIANSILLFLLLKRTTGGLWPSATVAALFAWHPVHVESVAWVAERKDVLSTFFWLLTMHAYFSYSWRPGWWRYALVVLLFACGLMSKPMVVTLPVVLLLMDFWPLNRFNVATVQNAAPATEAPFDLYFRRLKKLALEKLPLFALAGISSWVTIQVQVAGGAVSLTKLTLADKVQNAFISYVRYVGSFFCPRNLAVFYPYRSDWDLWQVIGAVILIGCVIFLVIYRMKRAPFLFSGVFWFLVTLLPVIGLIQVGEQSIADRYTYIPSIGLSIAVVWGSIRLLGKLPHHKWILSFGGIIALAVCVACTVNQVSYWKNSITLFSHALDATQDNAVAHYNLGQALSMQGKLEAAVPHYLAALKIHPEDSKAHNNLGLTLFMFGDTDAAITHYREALRINRNNEQAHYNYALALASRGLLDEAIEQHLESIRLKPARAESHFALAGLLAQKGMFDKAVSEYAEAIKYKPGYWEASLQMAITLSQSGKVQEAIPHYEETLQLNPNAIGALNNLAWIYCTHPEASVRNGARAVELAKHACQMTEDREPLLVGTLAAALAETGQFAQAAEAARKARTLALAANLPELAKRNAELEALYVSGTPYRDVVKTAAAAQKISP